MLSTTFFLISNFLLYHRYEVIRVKRNFQQYYRIVFGVLVIFSLLFGTVGIYEWNDIAIFDTIVGFTGYSLDGLISSIKELRKSNKCI